MNTHNMTRDELKIRVRTLESNIDHWKAVADSRWKMILAITGRSAEKLEDLLQAQQEGWRWAAECETEVKRLNESLKQANAQAEHFERIFYLQKESNEQLVEALEEIVELYGAGKSMIWAATRACSALSKRREQA